MNVVMEFVGFWYEVCREFVGRNVVLSLLDLYTDDVCDCKAESTRTPSPPALQSTLPLPY